MFHSSGNIGFLRSVGSGASTLAKSRRLADLRDYYQEVLCNVARVDDLLDISGMLRGRWAVLSTQPMSVREKARCQRMKRIPGVHWGTATSQVPERSHS